MRLVSTQYSLEYEAFEFYFSGCRGNCKNCHNPELKSFDLGQNLGPQIFNSILDKVNRFSPMIKRYWILGGDPIDQPIAELSDFLSWLRENTPEKEIVLFTRYSLENIPDSIKKHCDFIKTGEYIEELSVPKEKHEENRQENYGILLATSNQKVNKKGVDF